MRRAKVLMDGCIERWTDGRTDGKIEIWTDGRMDGKIEISTDRQKERWKDRQIQR